MIAEGQIVLFRFSNTTQEEGKLRPAVVLRRLPGHFDDWLVCMVSSQLHQFISDLDEIIGYEDMDFKESGLKKPSVIRMSRLAVVEGSLLLGRLGKIDGARLIRLKSNLCKWIKNELPSNDR
ncbi:MAG: type II toxin-antitoxin system PemK/MazF family toxin [Desulfamplus sp.]|nr:type II toxin-antitoxin system PemK/MazF family toxin [Desulfamplus sp.]